jgi:hypothetical protein
MGHVPRPYSTAALTIRHLLGAGRMGADAPIDWSEYVDHVRDQGQIQKCVGMAKARCLHILAQKLKFGRPNPGAVPYPSEDGIYKLAREASGDLANGGLQDVGSSPSAADEALSTDVGVPLERDAPPNDQTINQPLDVEVLARAIAIKMTGFYLITSDGSSRVDDACQALSQHGPFAMAIPVGDEYESCNSQAPVFAPQGKVYGGHAISIVGWRAVGSRRQFLNVGSWNTGWGFGGYAWLDESVLSDPRASDFSIPTLVTNWVGADAAARARAGGQS